MNIIFLDIDGVLNSLAYFEELHDCRKRHNDISDFHLKMLAQLYHKVNAKIVLSSTWRYLDDPSCKETYEMYMYLINRLKEYNMEIIDKTPVIHGDRPLEIKTWAEEHKCTQYVSLDDDFSLASYEKYGIGKHLVKTIYFCDSIEIGGLQQRHVDEAIQKFKKFSLEVTQNENN